MTNGACARGLRADLCGDLAPHVRAFLRMRQVSERGGARGRSALPRYRRPDRMMDPKAAKHNCWGLCQEAGDAKCCERGTRASLAPWGRAAAAGVELSL